jgi:hypothetical protein
MTTFYEGVDKFGNEKNKNIFYAKLVLKIFVTDIFVNEFFNFKN